MEPLHYILQQDIDKKKWDRNLSKCSNRLIYATSLYLDTMAGSWDAIIYGDYEILMPLPVRQKFGFRYVYAPAFTQQLGAFYINEPPSSFYTTAFKLILTKTSLIDYPLNYSNRNAVKSEQNYLRNNFTICLQSDFSTVSASLLPAFMKSLRRLAKHNFQYVALLNYDDAIQLYKTLYQTKQKSLNPADYKNFSVLVETLAKQNQVVCRQVVDVKNNVLAIALLLKDDLRLYNLISCTTPQGRKLEANYLLYHHLIKEFSGQHLMLDFEGSDVAGIANFYKKMGAVNEPYSFVKISILPKIIQWIKP